MRKHSLFGLALMVLAACGQPSFGSYFAPTAAVVNGSKIADSKIAKELATTLSDPKARVQFQGPEGPKRKVEAQREILSRLVKQEVIMQQARIEKITVQGSEVEAELEKLDQQFGGRKGLIAEAKKQNLTLDEVRVFFRDRLIIQKVADLVTKDVKPSDAKLRETYDKDKASFEEVRTAHILVCASFSQEQRTCTHTAEDEATANKVSARAKKGEDFAALAKEFSKDPSNKDTGGELPFFGRSSGFAPEFVEGAFLLQVGEISGAVKTPFGFHVIKMLERKQKTFEEVKAQLEQSSQQEVQAAFQKWLEERVGEAKIVINPRFGRFDSSSQRIVPRKLEVDSRVPGGDERVLPPG
ncbi:MAG: peptidylprolyl isomerase [Actinomycetota bacterium]